MNHIEESNYRTRAVEGRQLEVDESRMLARIDFEDHDRDCPDKGAEYYFAEQRLVPIKFETCGVCRGKGSHVNPAIDAGGLTREDFDADPDFEREYFSGMYDQTCNGCNGKRVEAVLDRDAAGLTDEQREAVEFLDDGAVADAEYRAECEAERRAGC